MPQLSAAILWARSEAYHPMIFETVSQFEMALQNLPDMDLQAISAAKIRQSQLTKPKGSLGRLEDIAAFFAGWQQQEIPRLEQGRVVVFAGSHGITSHQVSAFPDRVNQEMVANYGAGGGAINALAKAAGLELCIVPLDIDQPTQDFTLGPAMDEAECLAALSAGAAMVEQHLDLLVPGDMGLGNTTVASAICTHIFGGTAQDWVGPGSGVDAAGIARKIAVVEASLTQHQATILNTSSSAFETLRRLGGREVAAIAGAVLHAQHLRVPVILDGFISCAAIVPLAVRNPAITNHCIAGHCSAEPGHARLLKFLGLDPLLNLNMRLGEGSGAAVAVQVIRSALSAHAEMATFASASISQEHSDIQS